MSDALDAAAYADVKTALLEALDLPATRLTDWLDALDRERPATAQRVRRLLDAHRDAGTFLAVPDEGLFPPEPAPAVVVPGQRIGAFTIERELGHGGMGTVLLGTRTEGGFVQRVAIKVLRGAGFGPRAAERLKDERRIVAGLNHPLIAHFVDGGATDDGQPYLAMEYVEGVPITRYVEAEHLGVRERVQLFMQVCAAVRFAHTRLVVHRDIKPSNILVTADGTPKLLDFGIAKLLDPLQEPDAPTFGVLTPHYASPEQASGAPVTTATDVYSLGVLLYELLTGTGPYRSVSQDSPLGAVLDAIRHEDPEAPAVAARRVGREIGEDLDAILLKALRKDENDRYASVDHLRDDLSRALDGRPVLAHDGSRAYRIRRFVVRNRTAVAAASIALVSLLLAAGVSTWQARVARHERARADARFNDVRSLANAVVGPLYDAIAKVPGSTEAKQILVKEALAYLDRLASQDTGDLALQTELAAAYQKIGDVQGNMFDANLGDVPGAKASYARLLQLRQTVFDARPSDPAARRELARAHASMADLALGETRFDDALAGYRRGLAVLDGPAPPDDSEPTLLLRASALQHQGVALNWSGKHDDAVLSFEQAIALVEAKAKAPSASEAVRRSLMGGRGNLGDVFYYREQYAEALVHYRAAREAALLIAATSTDAATAQRNVYLTTGRVAAALVEVGDMDEAAIRRAEALAIQTEAAARDPRNIVVQFDLSNDLQSLGVIHYTTGHYAEARAALLRARDIADAALKVSPGQRSHLYDYAGILAWLGKTEVTLGRLQSGVDLLRQAVAITSGKDVDTRKPADRHEYQQALGDALAQVADRTGSAEARREAREAWQAGLDGFRRLQAAGELPASYVFRMTLLEQSLSH